MPGPIDVAYIEILPDLKRFRQTVVREIKKALQEAAKEVDALSKDLGEEISKSIGKGIDKTSNNIGKSVSDSITKGIKGSSSKITASLTAPIDQAAAQIQQIGEEIGTSFATVLGGGGGAGGFGGIGPLISESIKKGLSDTKKDTSTSLEKAVKEAADAAELPIADKLFRLGKQSGEAFGRGFGNVKGLFSKLNIASGLFGDIQGAIGSSFITKLLPVIVPALGAVATAATGLLGGTVIAAAGAFALKENEKFTNEIKKTGQVVKEVFSRAAEPLVGPFVDSLKTIQSIVKSLEPTFKNLFAGIAPAVKSLTTALGPTLTAIFKGLEKSLPGINAAFQGLAKGLPVVGKAIGDAFFTILGDDKLVRKVTSDLIFFSAALVNMLAKTINTMTVLFGAFVNFMRLLSMGLKVRWAEIIAAFDGGTGALIRITAAWEPLRVAILAVGDALKAFARAETNEEVVATFRVLVQKIKDAWEPLKNFITVVWDEVWAFVKRTWNEKVVPWWEDEAKPWITSQIKDFVIGVFNQMVDGVIDTLFGLPNKTENEMKKVGPSAKKGLDSGFGGSRGWLFGIGGGIVDGLIGGFNAKEFALAAAAGALGGIIRDNKGPEEKDKVMLRPAGRMIVQGLQDGMTDQQVSLQKQLSTMTTGIQNNKDIGRGVRVHKAESVTPNVTLTINSGGSQIEQLFVQVLRKVIRVQGGNVQKVLGQTSGGLA